MVLKTVRGVRNNNPLNIKRGDTWQGMTDQQSDLTFVKFIAPEWGIRAAVKILFTYVEQHRINTIRGIIYRWCPENPDEPENDPAAYLHRVCMLADFYPEQILNTQDHNQVLALVKAMASVECGGPPDYPEETWESGLRMAGTPRIRSVQQSRTGVGVLGVATGATAFLLNAARDVFPGSELILPDILARIDPIYISLAAFVVIAASNSLTLYARWDDYRQGRR